MRFTLHLYLLANLDIENEQEKKSAAPNYCEIEPLGWLLFSLARSLARSSCITNK